jgi:hypothetical protein
MNKYSPNVQTIILIVFQVLEVLEAETIWIAVAEFRPRFDFKVIYGRTSRLRDVVIFTEMNFPCMHRPCIWQNIVLAVHGYMGQTRHL